MLEEKKSTFENLYDLIKSMKRRERDSFEKDFSSKSKKTLKSPALSIFRAISKAKSFSGLGLAPSIVKDEKALYDNSRFLIQKIFEWLAKKDHEGRWEITMITKMIERGFFSNAVSVFRKQARIAHVQSDPYYLSCLYELSERFSTNYGVSVQFPNTVPSKSEINEELVKYFRAKIVYSALKEAFPKPINERLNAAKNHEKEILDFQIQGCYPSTQAVVLKAKSMWYFLKKEYQKVIGCRQVLHRVILNNPSLFSVEEKLNDFALTVPFMLSEKQFDEAEEVLYKLGSLSGPNQVINNKVVSSWVYLTLVFSAISGKTELGGRAMRELSAVEDYYSPSRKVLAFHCGSIVNIYLEDWEKALSLQKRVQRHGKNTLPNVFVTSYLISAIGEMELGDYFEAKRNLQKYQNHAEAFGLAYPDAIAAFLSRVMEANNDNRSIQLLLNQFESTLGILKNDPNEDFLIAPFDPSIWVASRISGRSISSILNEKNTPSMMQLKLIS